MPDADTPVVTFLTDFGLADFYVGAMKGALLRFCRAATIVDVTHAVPRHDIRFGAIMLERAVVAFPPGTVHVAVVDPGVGTARRILVARIAGQTVVCPDNGLLTWAWRRCGAGEAQGVPQAMGAPRATGVPAQEVQAYELHWRPAAHSHVFHGRDIMAPAAGLIAGGTPIDRLATPIADPVLLDMAPATDVRQGGEILHVDHFGNATTNVPEALLAGVRDVRVRGTSVGPPRRMYGDVDPGRPLALVGSSGLLEIAVREGSAAGQLGLSVGDRVAMEVGG